jgi:hypothetical protein
MTFCSDEQLNKTKLKPRLQTERFVVLQKTEQNEMQREMLEFKLVTHCLLRIATTGKTSTILVELAKRHALQG